MDFITLKVETIENKIHNVKVRKNDTIETVKFILSFINDSPIEE